MSTANEITILDPSVRWVLRLWQNQSTGWLEIRVYDFSSCSPRKKIYRLAHNGERFAGNEGLCKITDEHPGLLERIEEVLNQRKEPTK